MKGPNFGGIANNNVAVTALVFALVVSLFFIPEIIGFNAGKSSDEAREEIVVADVERTEIVAPEPKERPAPRRPKEEPKGGTLFASSIRQFSETVRSAVEDEEEPSAEMDRASIAPGIKQQARVSQEVVEEEEEQLFIPNGPGATWKAIRESKTKKFLTRATRDTNRLLKEVPLEHPESRMALFTYTGALRLASRGKVKRLLEPSELLPVLGRLDQRVTTALVRENVDRGVYLRWQEVSLGPVLQSSVATRLKMQYEQPFRPQITLESVNVIQSPGPHGARKADAPVRLSFRAFVVGTDTQRIEIYKDGQLVHKPRLKKKIDSRGRRRFKMSLHRDDRGSLYTIRAIGMHGGVVTKSYRFYPRVTQFKWKRSFGNFDIPFEDFDPRIDRTFRVSAERGSSVSQNRGFARF